MRRLLPVALLLLATSLRAASPGTAFTYHGFLKNGEAPFTGTASLRFTLYDAATDGATVGSPVTKLDIAVSAGAVNQSLDFGSNFDGSPRYVQVEVDLDGGSDNFTVLGPRVELAPVPYAIHAETAAQAAEATNAGTLDGVDSTAFAAATHAHNKLGNPSNSRPNVVYVSEGGNVGINTSSPSVPLDIRANTVLQGYFEVNSATEQGLYVEPGSGVLAFDSFYVANQDSTVTALSAVTNNNGRLGIGVNSPSAKLELGGTAGTDGIKFPDGTLQTTAYTGATAAVSSLSAPDGDPSAAVSVDNDGNTAVTGTLAFGSGATLTDDGADVTLAVDTSAVDQSQTVQPAIAPADTGATWQSFTAGVTSTLTEVQVKDGGIPGSIVWRLYEGEGTGGTLLSSGTVGSTNDGSWRRIVLADPVAVTAGLQYTLELDPQGSVASVLWSYSDGTYAGGRASLDSAEDHQFKTYVAATRTDLAIDRATGSVAIDGTTLNVDASNNRVGIGTASPTMPLEVSSTENQVAQFGSSSTVGTWLGLKNTSAGGTNWRLISTGEDNGEGTGNLLFSSEATGTRMYLDSATGALGVGTTAPVSRLTVHNSVNASDTSSLSYVATVYNSNTGTNADGLRIVTATGTSNTTNNYVQFCFNSNGTNFGSPAGTIQGNGTGGVSYNTTGSDYAEMLEQLDPTEKIAGGDVVGVFGGKVSLRTAGADWVMAVSTRAAFVGNWREGDDEASGRALIAFVGQIPVSVVGPVDANDYIVASGRGDGTAIAVKPSALTADQTNLIVGRAWEASQERGRKLVQTVVGLPAAANTAQALVRELHARDARIDALEARLERLEKAIGGGKDVASGN